jgi:5-methylcytosine-specific restriction endonuclease McrBC GTP-binding regulatory subunit McrB
MTKDPGPDPLKGNRLLAFLKNTKTERYRIYQPYTIRILLEQGAENNFSMKESEIISKILSLALHKTKKPVDKSLLKGYLKGLTSTSAYTWNSDLVFLEDDSGRPIWKLNPDEFHESQTEEILEQCNIQIGKFHVHASIDTKSKPEVYFIFAGKNESTNITWVSIAAQVLIENSGKPLHYKNEIGPRAVDKNLKSTNAQTPEETILRDIRHHMERFEENSFFTNPETATYGLKESMTFKQVIELVLFAYHKPMKSSEISKIIVENNLKDSDGVTPERTISTELIRDIETGDSSTFVKFDENKYALRTQTFQNISNENSNWYEEFLENIQDPTNSLDWETAGIDYREHANFDLTTKNDEELRELPKGIELTTIKNIKKGSIVVINKNNSDGIVNTGIVTKEYYFEKESTSYIHRIGIKYLNIPIPEINYEYNQGIYHSPTYQNQILEYLLGDKKDLIDKVQQTDTLSVNHDRTVEILRRKKNIILSGPPGTGKTYTAKKIARQITNQDHTIQIPLTDSTQWFEYLKAEIQSISRNSLLGTSDSENKIQINLSGEEKRIWISYANKSNQNIGVEVEIKENGLTWLDEVKSENAFVVIVNIFTKSFVIFSYDTLNTYGNFRGGTDKNTGNPRKWFTLPELSDSSAILNVHDSVNISNGLNNFELLNSVFQSNIVTFHQSYGYEEFIEGIRPVVTKGVLTYPIKKGVFHKICTDAKKNSEKDFVIIIDEINRGNISKIFGELITIIENDKRGNEVTLSYSGEKFSIPDNVYVIGTMNTADQSLTQIDAALKRRFSTIDIMPDSSVLGDGMDGLKDLMDKINDNIRKKRSRDNQIGHSYFMHEGKPIDNIRDLRFAFATDVIPVLRDYFYADEEELRDVLNGQFINWSDDARGDLIDDWQDDDAKFKEAISTAFDVTL